MKVAGRTSSFSFKGRKVQSREIGEQLKVRTILEGSVRRSGARVRITAQLLDAADGYQLWSERYDREIEDVFALQDEIAATIASKLRASLALGTAERAQRATHSIEAYEATLKGRALLARRGKSIVEGIASMERALALDPTYGPAWAGLAEGYAMLGYYSMVTPAEARAKVVPAAEQAVRFAPDIAESHAALGIASLLFEWEDRARTNAAFRRAMELGPTSSQSAIWYWSFYLAWASSHESEGLAGMLALHARDPLSAFVCGMLAILEASLGRSRSSRSAAVWQRRSRGMASRGTDRVTWREQARCMMSFSFFRGPWRTRRVQSRLSRRGACETRKRCGGRGSRSRNAIRPCSPTAERASFRSRLSSDCRSTMSECMREVNWPTDPYVHVPR
jgi:tetratricopeptide (TPR) repeat protein